MAVAVSCIWLSDQMLQTLEDKLAPARMSSATLGASFSPAAISNSRSTAAVPAAWHHLCLADCTWLHKPSTQSWTRAYCRALLVAGHMCPGACTLGQPHAQVPSAEATAATSNAHLCGKHAHVVEILLHIVCCVVVPLLAGIRACRGQADAFQPAEVHSWAGGLQACLTPRHFA